MKQKLLIFFFLINIAQNFAQPLFIPETDTLTFAFTGDLMMHDSQILAGYNYETKTYNYDSFYVYVKPLLSDANLTIGNLEFNLAGPPYKGYPRFGSPDATAYAIKKAGFDALVTANNHCTDRGKQGLIRTIKMLDSLAFWQTGTFESENDRQRCAPLIIEKKGIRIALLNYTYGVNMGIGEDNKLVNFIDTKAIQRDVNLAKKKNPDKIIAFMHWGPEYHFNPSKRQIEIHKFCDSIGIDIVIGAHPHVMQRIERYDSKYDRKKKLVAYSLGNFISSQRKNGRDGGMILKFSLYKNRDKCVIGEVGYQLTWVYAPRIKGRKRYYILPLTEYEKKEGFFFNDKDYWELQIFAKDMRELFEKQNKDVKEISN